MTTLAEILADMRRVAQALAHVDFPLSGKDEVHIDVAWRIAATYLAKGDE